MTNLTRARSCTSGLMFSLVALSALGNNPAIAAECPDGLSTFVFEHTGSLQTLTLPNHITSTYIIAQGGSGGSVGSVTPQAGGRGARVGGRFEIQGGETLQIMVGGAGSSRSSFNGGGGGGGASMVIQGATLTSEGVLLVAAGGGGAGRGKGATGGDGGAPPEPVIAANDTAGGRGSDVGGAGGAGVVEPDPTAPELGGAGGDLTLAGDSTPNCGADGGSGLSSAAVAGAQSLLDGGNPAEPSITGFVGGFGGGGRPLSCGGGGGGYSGGGAGGDGNGGNVTQGGGGGGGSINFGTESIALPGFGKLDADGVVLVCYANSTLEAPSAQAAPAPAPVAVPVGRLWPLGAFLILWLAFTGKRLQRRRAPVH